jgi:hypothetical protein
MAVTRRTRNAVVQRWARGFESHRFRQTGHHILIEYGVLFLLLKSVDFNQLEGLRYKTICFEVFFGTVFSCFCFFYIPA